MYNYSRVDFSNNIRIALLYERHLAIFRQRYFFAQPFTLSICNGDVVPPIVMFYNFVVNYANITLYKFKIIIA